MRNDVKYLPVLFLVAFLILSVGIANPVSGEVKQWKVGGKDISWDSQAEELVMMDTKTIPGAIQPVEAHAANNIIQMVHWRFGPPLDYIKEGDGHIWGGAMAAVRDSDLVVLIDGDPSTSTENMFKEAKANQLGRTFFFDLGSTYSASRLVFYPRQEGKDERGYPYRDYYLKAYEVYISDGNTYQYDRPVYKLLARSFRNTRSIVDIHFPLQPVRFIKLRSASSRPFEIAEVELYGSGFMAKASYLSKVISLEGIANYGKLGWKLTKWRRSGEDLIEDPTANVWVEVRTRSGTDPTPEKYLSYEGGDTVEVTKRKWEKLAPDKRNSDTYDRDHWSLWSPPHLIPGEQIISPGPRQYFQFQVILYRDPNDVMVAARLDSLWFWYSTPPLAKQVVGEIALQQKPVPPEGKATVVAGKQSTFTYDLRAEIDSPQQYGFDALKIDTPAQVTFRGLEMGTPLVPVQPDSVDTSHPDYMVVYFPSHRITFATNEPLRVLFDTCVFLYGTVFTAHVFDTWTNELPQAVDPGDANPNVGTNSLKVLVTKSSLGKIIASLDLSPNLITPNNDGKNEQTTISYKLVQLIFSKAKVNLGIYDLSGTQVRSIVSSERKTIGSYTEVWDGRNDEGELVSPGVYICKLSVETDTETLEETRTIAVVY